jgi:hypothetical protein
VTTTERHCDQSDFDTLQRDLIAEFTPSGALENDIVMTMARLLWRKQNLRTLRLGEAARTHYAKIRNEHAVQPIPTLEYQVESEEGIQAAEDQAKRELGENYRFVDIGDAATFAALTKELDIKERMDSLIERCLKRLLYVRGLKSISKASASSEKLISSPRAA